MARLSLAYRDLEEVPVAIAQKYAPAAVDLDLSHNALRSLSSVQSFGQLRTLVLDNNELHSHVQWPFFPHLETLWINHNLISNLPLFIDKVATAYPKLRELRCASCCGALIALSPHYAHKCRVHAPTITRSCDTRPIPSRRRGLTLTRPNPPLL